MALFFACATLALASPAAAETGALFAGLEGAWSGEGSARLTDGSTTPLHCQANYSVSGGGDHLDVGLDCAGVRQRFSFRIQLDQTNGAILGGWQELTHQVQGGVSGSGGAGRLELTARGQAFTAQASFVARGGRQTIAIRSSGAGFTSASILLRRGR